MKNPSRAVVCLLLFAAALARNTAADNLVQDGDFVALTYSGTAPLTTLYGEVGTISTSNTLKLTDWSTAGYNFVYAPGTADAGTSTGANSGEPNEAPGQYNASNGYGNTYLFGANNSTGSLTLSTYPGGGNFIAADGAYNPGAITQTINGLTIGNVYTLSFYWAGAQQYGASYTSATTENWTVTLGNQSQTTKTVSVVNKGFSGWMQQTFDYTATSTSETLSFLAAGTPTGQPPFSLLGGVTLNVVPEPSTWMLFVGLGAAGTVISIVRRRRLSRRDAALYR